MASRLPQTAAKAVLACGLKEKRLTHQVRQSLFPRPHTAGRRQCTPAAILVVASDMVTRFVLLVEEPAAYGISLGGADRHPGLVRGSAPLPWGREARTRGPTQSQYGDCRLLHARVSCVAYR
jgi:hypothetical protein